MTKLGGEACEAQVLTLREFWNEGVLYTSPCQHFLHMVVRGWKVKKVILIGQLYIDLEREFYKPFPDQMEYYNTKTSLVTKHLKQWCEESCKGKVYTKNGFWWEFQKKEDAMLFMLRWS